MGNWQDKVQVKKGNFAEEIVHKFLESKGYIVYSPTTDGPHAFDRLAIKNKEKIIIADIKAKAKLRYYEETGINLKHYKEYKNISSKHSIKVFIFFVDEFLREIYGNFLHVLEQDSRIDPWNGNTILFKMNYMLRNIYKLNEEQVDYLKKHSSRSYEYQ